MLLQALHGVVIVVLWLCHAISHVHPIYCMQIKGWWTVLILETIEASVNVTRECEYEVICSLSNDVISSDPETTH